MHDLSFTIAGARVEPYAASPTLMLRLRIAAAGEPVHAILLRCQLRIEPRRREYSPGETDRLYELFGEPAQWGGSLKPLLWTHTSLMVPAFTGEVETDLPVPCTYDLEVAGSRYFQALENGEIPLLALFSGTVFAGGGPQGFTVRQIPWDREASFRLPLRVWRETMDHYFPGTTWIRLRRESLDALNRYRARNVLATWDDAVERLLLAAGLEKEEAA